MNRYTLIFADKNLETMYQKQRLDSTRYPLLLYLSLGIIVLLMAELIQLIALSSSQGLVMKACVLAYTIVQLMIITKKKQYTQVALFIINHIVMITELTLQRSQSPGIAYLFGGNNMMIHAVIIFTSDFREAVLTNISLLIIRCIITNSYSPNAQFQQYFYASMICFFVQYIMYNLDKSVRSSYLFNLKDNQWEKLLPSVIKNKFYLFRFNEENLQFQTRCTNDQESLKETLRAIKLSESTLEQYIFKRTNTKLTWTVLDNYSQEIKAKLNGKAIKLTYHEFYLEQRIYLIVFEEEDSIQRKACQEIVQTQQAFLSRFVNKVEKVIWQGLKNKSQIEFHHLHLSLLEVQARLLIETKQILIGEVEFGKLVQLAIKYFKQVTKSNIVLNRHQLEEDTYIYTYKTVFFLWIVQVLKHHTGKLVISLSNTSKGVQLRLIGKINPVALQRDQFFQQGLKLLQINYIPEDKSLVFQFNFQITASFMD